MLNISWSSIKSEVDEYAFETYTKVEERRSQKVVLKVLTAVLILVIIAAFLPWTQNIRAKGNVTTFTPDSRPQTVHSIIDGRIEKWYVQEGDFVTAGDTILFISEVKDDYLDPALVDRTEGQKNAKAMSVSSYREKVRALDMQIESLGEMRELKINQTKNKLRQAQLKVVSDSIDYEAAKINATIAQRQFDRIEQLYEDGLKSLTDKEKRELTVQKTMADMISKENQLLASRNEVLNNQIELNALATEYQKEIAKARSDRYSALSSQLDAEGNVNKLENQLSNYKIRQSLYYILAPQDGYVTQAIQSGIGETIKGGDEIVSIMPSKYDLAIEMYVKPIDLPLVQKGEKVRILFDGWPAIVFSGWPNASFGTYGGVVYAIDNFISANGKFRIMVMPDENEPDWPDAIRVGAGTSNLLLLNDVPLWYEFWRQMNGFPPNYYENVGEAGDLMATKK